MSYCSDIQMKVKDFDFGREVRKETCLYCFYSCENPLGIFMCLDCGVFFCEQELQMHKNKCGHFCFINIRKSIQKIDNKERAI